MKHKKEKCLSCGENWQRARGLCRSCYSIVSGYVRRGHTTWATLEETEVVLPVKRGVRGSSILSLVVERQQEAAAEHMRILRGER